MKTFQEKVEALSDEFQSTFTILDDGSLSNLFDVREVPEVKALVQRHIRWENPFFIKTSELSGTYDVWVIQKAPSDSDSDKKGSGS